MQNQQEAFLIQQLKQGNQAVFEELYTKYYSRLVAFADGYLYDHEESKELVQNFFISFWLNISELNIQKSTKSYLFTSIKNRCLNQIKKLKITDEKKLQYMEAYLYSESIKTQDGGDFEISSEVMKQMNKLPAQIKEILILKYMKGKKRSEIATELGISENTIKTQLRRGKKKLKSALGSNILKIISLLFFV